ncbi:UvrD-helicase domain-containing protein [Candidatus Saccharibacteria bacterium]|nr:UvrD-helicase domain-containing protein [Candidatus Saccharibacteria bacterium]
MKDRLLEGLNSEQRRAVETTEGPLLIQAGAGSGKTKTLTHRIGYIIDNDQAAPSQILAVTFTNKAAREMRERLAKLLHHDPSDRSFVLFMGTFHSICVKLLRRDGSFVGVPQNFVIFDETDRLSAVKRVCKELSIDEKKYPPRQIANIISSAKNELIDSAQYKSFASSPIQSTAADVFPKYEKVLKDAGALDFDDLIGKTVELLEKHEVVRKKWQDHFKYILIDEYQDTNSAQYKLIKLIVNKNNNIAVVGDDWQSIYSWRGADFRNILNFTRDYPSATVIKLEQNYRSTKNILDAAHSVISNNNDRSEKKLWTDEGEGSPVLVVPVANERAEAEVIVRKIQESVDRNPATYDDFAVLYRTNAQSRSIEETFIRYGLPYKIIGGVRFYDRKEIKDIIAYIRLIYQPEDQISFERIVNVPARGVGAKSLINFFSWQAKNSFPLSTALARVEECDLLTPKAKNAIRELNNTLNDLREISEGSPPYALIDFKCC